MPQRGSDQKEELPRGGRKLGGEGEIRLLTVGTISRKLHTDGVHLSSREQSPFLPRHIHIARRVLPECPQALYRNN